jgi:hypothetical protein
MQGLMRLQPTNEVVGKKKEYKSKEDFIEAVREEEGKEAEIEDVGTAYMRYYPKGTENSEMEFGKGEGVYMCVDKLTMGAFEVWIV